MTLADTTPLAHGPWLVTGAAGFIGSHLVEHLLRGGARVIGLDNFATGHRRNLDDVMGSLAGDTPDAEARFEFIEGDIRDLDACRRAATGARVVLHQAALGSVPRSIDDPLTTNAVNVDGFLNVLVAARDAGVEKFVYASSSSVYGDSSADIKREGEEGSPLSPYAASKRTNEMYAAAFDRSYGMRLVGLRYFNVYGPRQDPNGPYAAVIPRWINALLRGERCRIFGDGETSRDFTFVADVVAANIAAGQATDAAGAYNVAYGTRTTLKELYRVIRERVDSLGDDVSQLDPIYEPFRPGDVRYSLADVSRAASDLGYRPAVSPDDGLERTAHWFAGIQ